MDYISWIRSKVGHDKVIMNFVVALLRNDKGEVLMQQRGDSGLWGFPGGCLEVGETFEEALRREIKEETQVSDFKIIGQLGAYNWLDLTYPNGDVAQPIDIWYVCDLHEAIDLTYQDEETLSLAWVDLTQLKYELFNKNFQQAIDDYLNWVSAQRK